MLPPHGFFFGQIISLFQSPPMELHGCLWRTREIISFHLYNYTLSWNKSIFANDVISRFVPTGSQALTKPLSCRQESYPVGCRAKMELSEDVIHFISRFPFCLSNYYTAYQQTFYKCSLEGFTISPQEIKEEGATVLFTFPESSSTSAIPTTPLGDSFSSIHFCSHCALT